MGPGYFGYFLVEENPATVVVSVVLLTAYHLCKADNSPGRFFNICFKDSSFVGFESNGKSLLVITQQFGQVCRFLRFLRNAPPTNIKIKPTKTKRPEYRGIQVANVSNQYKFNLDTCFSPPEKLRRFCLQ